MVWPTSGVAYFGIVWVWVSVFSTSGLDFGPFDLQPGSGQLKENSNIVSTMLESAT